MRKIYINSHSGKVFLPAINHNLPAVPAAVMPSGRATSFAQYTRRHAADRGFCNYSSPNMMATPLPEENHVGRGRFSEAAFSGVLARCLEYPVVRPEGNASAGSALNYDLSEQPKSP